MQKEQTQTGFNGGNAKYASYLGRLEAYITAYAVPKIPKSIETQHLTLLTVPLAFLALLCSYAAQHSVVWLLGVSACIVMQYFTDLFDGAVGRYRKTGLVTWGFFMDHMLDYMFVAVLVLGWLFFVPLSHVWYVLVIFIAWAGIMIHSFLYFAATATFQISYAGWGPTEFRLFLISLYLATLLFGKAAFLTLLPIVSVGSLIFLLVLIFTSSRYLWSMDMQRKRNKR